MSDILTSIVEHKRLEIKELKVQIESTAAVGDAMAFPAAIRRKRAAGAPFFIFEFKRKSPSEGWINREADLKTQIFRYVEAGAGAISVLTDGHFFGGSHTDLREAAALLRTVPPENAPCFCKRTLCSKPRKLPKPRLAARTSFCSSLRFCRPKNCSN